MGGTKLTLLDFKVVIAESLIGAYTNRQGAFPQFRPSKRKSLEQAGPVSAPDHLSEYQVSRNRCKYCKDEGLDNKAFVLCKTCDVHLCLVKERNCFLKHHKAYFP